MRTANPWALKAAEAYEKAAQQSTDRGNRTKAAEEWEKAGNAYIQAGAVDRALPCLERAGRLEARAIELLAASDPRPVLATLRAKGLQRELALAYLHLESRGSATDDTDAFETCWAATEASGTSPAEALCLLKGALLAAAWREDKTGLLQAVNLALGKVSVKPSTDATLLLLIKIAASGDLSLVLELSKGRTSIQTNQGSPSAFEVRLIAPIYLYRGIKLNTLLETMRTVPRLRRFAELYDTLLAGIDCGEADAALEQFVNTIVAQADRADPKTPVCTWEDVERRLPNILYAHPEYLAALILHEQGATIRAGGAELRGRIGEARTHLDAQRWAESIACLEEVVPHPIFAQLPSDLQAEVYVLGCTAAFQAEEWDRFDRWAAILEGQYKVQDALRRVLDAGPSTGAPGT